MVLGESSCGVSAPRAFLSNKGHSTLAGRLEIKNNISRVSVSVTQ
jgi:hypothetical protein